LHGTVFLDASPWWCNPVLTNEPIYHARIFFELNISSCISWTCQPGWRKDDFADKLAKLAFLASSCFDSITYSSPVEPYGMLILINKFDKYAGHRRRRKTLLLWVYH